MKILFHSSLSNELQNFLLFKRNLGYRYNLSLIHI